MAGRAGSRTRSTRSPLPGRRCGSRTCRGRSRASGCTARSSCWSTTATISSMSAGAPSSGCAGTCTSSTRPWSCRCADSTAQVISNGSAVGWRGVSRTSRCGRTRARQPLPLTHTLDRRAQRELEQRTAGVAPALLELPGCGAVTAAKLLAEIGPIKRFKPTHNSPATAASRRSKQAQAAPSDTDSTAAATAN